MPKQSAPFAAIAATLILLSLLAQFVRFHRYDPLQPEVLLVGALFAAIGVGCATLARLRPATLEPLILGIFVSAFLTKQAFGSGLHRTLVSTIPIGSPGLVVGSFVLLQFLLVLALTWALRRQIGQVLTVVFGAILVSTLLLPTPTAEGGIQIDQGDAAATDPALPPLIHIILDEHIGIEGIPSEMPDGTALVDRLRTVYPPADFALYGRAYSRFAETQYSMSSLMNGAAPADAHDLVSRSNLGYRMLRNRWFHRLREQGYRIRVYESAWLDYCDGTRDLLDYCYEYPVFSIEPLQRADMNLMDKAEILLRVMFKGVTKLSGQDAPQLGSLASMEAFDRFVGDFFDHPRGTAFVVHLLLPHFSYIYDRDCRIRKEPATWFNLRDPVRHDLTASERTQRYGLYLRQAECIGGKLARFFDAMRAGDHFDDAVIIVHGDHGSRIALKNFRLVAPDDLSDRDMIDLFSTLFAVKAPQIAPGYRRDQQAIQDLFAALFLDAALSSDDAAPTIWTREAARPGGPFSSRRLPAFGMPPD